MVNSIIGIAMPFLGIMFLWNFWPTIKKSWLFKKSSWSTKEYDNKIHAK